MLPVNSGSYHLEIYRQIYAKEGVKTIGTCKKTASCDVNVYHMGGKLTAEKVRKRDERMHQVMRREELNSAPPRAHTLCGNRSGKSLKSSFLNVS